VAGIAADAALQFDPGDAAAIAAAMNRVCDDAELRARLAAAGPQRAAQFSWKATAEATLGAVLNVCSE
jgi:glycosyltransferase involved in cell wall biosynthesis